MKLSEGYQEIAKEMRIASIIFLVLGYICLIAMVAIIMIRVDIIALLVVAALCLLFFGAWAWIFFIEYPCEKHLQRIAEEEESKEESVREQALSKK